MKEILLTVLTIPLAIIALLVVLAIGHIIIVASMLALSLWFIQAVFVAFYKTYVGAL